MKYKYIFCAGAPGSKWSSLIKNIYYSPDVDRSDYSDARTYYHDASGTMDLMHLGAYFDPGMEFDLSQQMNLESKDMLEEFFDSAFAPDGKGVRIVKSHVFCHQIPFLKQHWPDCPIVLVHRPNDACLGWWVKCGEFKITYPLYRDYYLDLRQMAQCIRKENEGNRRGAREWPARAVETNLQLSRILGLADPPTGYRQDYVASDIKVTVI